MTRRLRILLGAAITIAAVAVGFELKARRNFLRTCSGQLGLVEGGWQSEALSSEQRLRREALHTRVERLPVVDTWRLLREHPAAEGEEVDADYELGPFIAHQHGIQGRSSTPHQVAISLKGACSPRSIDHDNYMSGILELRREPGGEIYYVVTRNTPDNYLSEITAVRISR